MAAMLLDVFRLIGSKKTLFRRKASVRLSNGHFHSFPRGDPQDSLPLYLYEDSRERIATRQLRLCCRRCYALLTFLQRETKRRPFASSPLTEKNHTARIKKCYEENVKISRKIRNLIKCEQLSFE